MICLPSQTETSCRKISVFKRWWIYWFFPPGPPKSPIIFEANELRQLLLNVWSQFHSIYWMSSDETEFPRKGGIHPNQADIAQANVVEWPEPSVAGFRKSVIFKHVQLFYRWNNLEINHSFELLSLRAIQNMLGYFYWLLSWLRLKFTLQNLATVARDKKSRRLEDHSSKVAPVLWSSYLF